jgi:DNA-binding NtrC family response regulator
MQQNSRRILIVDDEQGIRKLLAMVFTRAGYEVCTAADGAEAMGFCESGEFDALLSDVRMPGMNGHELVRWVVTRHPQTSTILMSGFDDIECQQCGIAPRPCSLLPKPFQPTDAVALVDRVLTDAANPLISLS